MRFFYAIMIGVLFSSPTFAAKKENAVPMKPDIAAVVGQEVISTYDLDNRIKFIMVSSNLPLTDEVRARLRPQVIRTLVDEKLQRADAEKNGIKVGDNEVQEAILGIEKERNMPPGTIFSLLERDHIPKETFTEQIRSQLSWRKLVLKKLRPLVRINDEEVKLVKLAPVPAGAPQEIKMAALTLPVDKPSREKEVLATAMKLAKELRAGASFEEVSRQLSGRALKGNEAFWVKPEQLDPLLAHALAAATAGMISEPVRTQTGFAIVKVYETRSREAAPTPKDSEVAFKDILLKEKIGAPPLEAGKLMSIAENVAKNPGTCEEKTLSGENVKDIEVDVSQRREMASALPPTMQTVLAALKPGEVSPPQENNGAIHLFMLCERKEQTDADVDLDRAKNQVYQQKIELEAQKYLRNLRRDTFIDIR
jgi:peptidyl-prolyl cis-trans isomerase SurA